MRYEFQNALNKTAAVGLGLALFVGIGLLARFEFGRLQHSHSKGLNGWRPISGRWTSQANVLSNTNYGRGDMIIAEHSDGGDYGVSADVRFDILFPETHYGDAGLVIRATDPEPGVDSYMGYYAGLRPNDQALILGRATYDWRELAATKLAAPVSTGVWYHIELTARGCKLSAVVSSADGRPGTRLDYQDDHCLEHGAAGLRSFYAQASWRNVQVVSK